MRRGFSLKLPKLLFELSSDERMNIVNKLKKQKLKLSQISRILNIGIPETARHLQRLSQMKLIEKDSDAYFKLTPFGIMTLTLLSGLDFASSHAEYFLEYDISAIPEQFVERIGELKNVAYSSENLKNIAEGDKRIREAQDLVWILSDQVLASSIPTLIEKVKTRFDLRIILPEGRFPPESESKLPSTNPAIHKRVLKEVTVVTVITDKFAIFCFPNRNGIIDYTGFSGEDPNFRQWCKDVFQEYWEKAKPIRNP